MRKIRFALAVWALFALSIATGVGVATIPAFLGSLLGLNPIDALKNLLVGGTFLSCTAIYVFFLIDTIKGK